MQKVHFIFRSQELKRFSIEKVFQVVIENLRKKHFVTQQHLPYLGASPFTIVKNVLFFKKIKGICHITGDAHYLAIFNGKNSLLTIHDVGSAAQGNILKRLYIRLFWFWLPAFFVNKISVISEFTKVELSKIIPFAKDKIEVVPNPVDSSFSYQEKLMPGAHPQVLCIGTKPNKNLERSIVALGQLNCNVHIVGQLSAAQNDLLSKHKIQFINSESLTDEAMKQAYINCDILCFPSIYEGFGMPIIEAQAIGRPVLTSDLGAMKEVAGNTACLVNPLDVDSIRLGLIRLIENQSYRKDLIKKGLENVKHYQVEKIADRYWKIYTEIDES